MRRTVTALSTVCAALAMAVPAHAAKGDDTPKIDAITIGDSVQLGARSVLQSKGVAIVDAKKNRQASTGPDLLRKRGDRLPTNVVVHLGTNGGYSLQDCKDMVRIAGPDRKVYLLTIAVPRKWESVNNATIRQCARAFPVGRVQVIDWKAATKAHPAWLYSDGVHLQPVGARGYTRLILQALTPAE